MSRWLMAILVPRSLLQRSNVRNEILDLSRIQTFFERWHGRLALSDNVLQLLVRLLLHISRAKIAKLELFAHGRGAATIRAMAGGALSFIKVVRRGESWGGKSNGGKSCGDEHSKRRSETWPIVRLCFWGLHIT